MSATVWIILAGAVATYLTRIGGNLIISRFEALHPRVEAGLNAVQVSEHKRQPRTPDKSASKSATAQAAVQVNDWASVAGFALMLSQIAHKLTDVEGHESQCKDARDALAEAAEVLAPFIPKAKKSVVKA